MRTGPACGTMSVMNFRLHWFALVVVSGLSAAAFMAACPESDPRCSTDTDCPGARCDVDSGECVACLDTNDCADGEACCQGACRVGSPEELCGCEASASGDSTASMPWSAYLSSKASIMARALSP